MVVPSVRLVVRLAVRSVAELLSILAPPRLVLTHLVSSSLPRIAEAPILETATAVLPSR